MKNLVVIFTCCIYLVSCTKEDIHDNISPATSKATEDIIYINTTRSPGNILGYNDSIQTRSGGVGDDPFTEIREAECFESVILPELQPHIWVGNILTKSSIINCVYKPLVYPRTPITLSLTLPGTFSQSIAKPSYSQYLAYIQEQTEQGTYVQNNEFSFSVDQFTSYNELKVAFGSNVNTSGIFWKSSTSTSSEDHTINKATGLYVKFYQTSFKAIMDYPDKQIATIPSNMIDSAVYINSITYGRLGILTIETNEAVAIAKNHINKIFKTIFYNSSTSFTQEEQNFLNGCEFKIYMIGGNSSTSVETFTGLTGFLQHIKKGSFNKNEPGVPIFTTFNYVKDNSPVSVNFRFSVKREPLYVELVCKPIGNKVGDLYLYFYANQAKVPTIAHPAIKFNIKHDYWYWEWTRSLDNRDLISHKVDTTTYQNAGYQTSLKIMSNVWLVKGHAPISRPAPRGDHDHEPGELWKHEYMLLESPNNEYKSIGYNPINSDNTKIN